MAVCTPQQETRPHGVETAVGADAQTAQSEWRCLKHGLYRTVGHNGGGSNGSSAQLSKFSDDDGDDAEVTTDKNDDRRVLKEEADGDDVLLMRSIVAR
jgi:hypothetical protein